MNKNPFNIKFTQENSQVEPEMLLCPSCQTKTLLTQAVMDATGIKCSQCHEVIIVPENDFYIAEYARRNSGS